MCLFGLHSKSTLQSLCSITVLTNDNIAASLHWHIYMSICLIIVVVIKRLNFVLLLDFVFFLRVLVFLVYFVKIDCKHRRHKMERYSYLQTSKSFPSIYLKLNLQQT